MIVNRLMLIDMGLTEYESIRVLNKARDDLKIELFDKMVTDRAGRLSPMSHFDLKKFIESYEDFIKKMRENYREKNLKLLNKIKGMV